MADQSRQEPAKFVAGGAASSVLVGTALIIVANAEVRKGHGIVTTGWFKGGLALVIVGGLLVIVSTAMFFWSSVFDRVEVDVTPEQLIAFFKDVTNVQGRDRAARYIGKWMRLSGRLEDVRRSTSSGVMVTFEGRSIFSRNEAFCFFRGKRDSNRIKLKSLGDEVTLIGRIGDVNSQGVTLNRCRLEAQRSHTSTQRQLPITGIVADTERPSTGSGETRQEPERAEVRQEPERVIVDVTPEQLTAFFDGVTNVQGQDRAARYIGKWMRVSGTLRDVLGSSPNAMVVFEGRSLFLNNDVTCYFEGKKWADRLAMKDRGDNVALIGRITKVNSQGVDLYGCELEA